MVNTVCLIHPRSQGLSFFHPLERGMGRETLGMRLCLVLASPLPPPFLCFVVMENHVQGFSLALPMMTLLFTCELGAG